MNCGKMEVILKININRIDQSHLFILSIFVIINTVGQIIPSHQ